MLGTIYGEYMAHHGGSAPSSEQVFVSHLSQEKKLGNEAVQRLLCSPRDGEKLVMRFGKLAGPLSENGYPWIACEQTGVDGKRYLVSARGELLEVDSQNLSEYIPTE